MATSTLFSSGLEDCAPCRPFFFQQSADDATCVHGNNRYTCPQNRKSGPGAASSGTSGLAQRSLIKRRTNNNRAPSHDDIGAGGTPSPGAGVFGSAVGAATSDVPDDKIDFLHFTPPTPALVPSPPVSRISFTVDPPSLGENKWYQSFYFTKRSGFFAPIWDFIESTNLHKAASGKCVFSWLRTFLVLEALLFWTVFAYQYFNCAQRHECHRLITTLRNLHEMPRFFFWLTTASIFGGTAVILSSLTERLLIMMAMFFEKAVYGKNCYDNKEVRVQEMDDIGASDGEAMTSRENTRVIGSSAEYSGQSSGAYGASSGRMDCDLGADGGIQHCSHCPQTTPTSAVAQQAGGSSGLYDDDAHNEFRSYLENIQALIRRPLNIPEDPDALRLRRQQRQQQHQQHANNARARVSRSRSSSSASSSSSSSGSYSSSASSAGSRR